MNTHRLLSLLALGAAMLVAAGAAEPPGPPPERDLRGSGPPPRPAPSEKRMAPSHGTEIPRRQGSGAPLVLKDPVNPAGPSRSRVASTAAIGGPARSGIKRQP